MKIRVQAALHVILLTLSAAAADSGQGADRNAFAYDTALYDALEYRTVGPYRGGRSTAVAGIPERLHTFFMGTTGGGVWKTTDAGHTWENISDGYFGGSIGAVAVATSDPNVIYVGQGSADIRGNTSTGLGVYKSLDGGKTWEHVLALDDSTGAFDLAMNPGPVRMKCG